MSGSASGEAQAGESGGEPSRPRVGGGRRLARFGPAALVTGASDGIGKAIAERLAAEGFDLVLVARREDRLEELAARLRVRHGVAVDAVPADLSEPAGVRRAVEAGRVRDAGLWVLAAGFGSAGRFIDLSIESELDMVDVNVRAVVAMAHAAGSLLRERGAGGLVLFSSIVAFQGVGHSAIYAATKAFVQSFAEALRFELKPLGVEVLAVAPGPVETGFGPRAGLRMARADRPDDVARDTLEALGRTGLVRPGRFGKLLAAGFAFAPRPIRVHVLSRLMRDMAADRRAPP